MWMQWVNGILGLVLIVAAFLGLAGSTLTWTLVVLGVIIAILGFWGASTNSSSSMSPSMR